MIVFGRRLLGRTDRVPGLGSVGTVFFHLEYIPLIPLQSYLIMAESEGESKAIEISLSGKSIVLAWMRAFSVIGILGGIVGTIIYATEANGADLWGAVAMVSIMAGSGGVLWFGWRSEWANGCSYERALRIARKARLNPRWFAVIAKSYGREE